MTYYINPIWFYLMNVSTELKFFLYLSGCLIIVIGIVLEFKELKKILITGIILIFIGILLPSKEVCIEMIIASQVTHENVTATKEEIYEIVDYVTDKVKGEDKE